MPVFLNTQGNPTLGIGICSRCSRKFPLHELQSDPNYPGLRVCRADLDQFDPYRLPARQTETITLPFVRPDEPLTGVAAPAPVMALFEVVDEGDDFIVFDGD
jgi:hypothetical protein